MARRKHRSFGSPPEVHQRHAKEAIKASRFWIRETRRSLRVGNCKGALDHLLAANRTSATATVERRGGGKKRAMFQTTTLRKLQARFDRACVR